MRLPAALMIPSTCSTAALRCFQVALPRSEISLPVQQTTLEPRRHCHRMNGSHNYSMSCCHLLGGLTLWRNTYPSTLNPVNCTLLLCTAACPCL